VVSTVAAKDEGVGELGSALERHFGFLSRSGSLAARRSHRLELRTRQVVDRMLRRWVWSEDGPRAALEAALADVAAGKCSPYEAAAGVVERMRRTEPHERV
jgi:LAO/AO transport system kinase